MEQWDDKRREPPDKFTEIALIVIALVILVTGILMNGGD